MENNFQNLSMRALAAADPLAQAKITNPALGPALQAKTGVEYFQAFFPAVVGMGLVIGVVIFLFYMIMGAISWITAGSDKATIESARNQVVNALIGLFILFVMFAIINVLEEFFGINILTLDIGPLKIQ